MKSAAQSFRHLAPYMLASYAILLGSSLAAQARTFDAVGSDLLMGVGGRDIALGGAVVASTGDAYSSYWNPAGLAELGESQLAFSRQIDGTLDPLSFVGIAVSRPQLKAGRYKVVFAYAWIPRLHVKAAGNFSADEFESTFTQYALPGLPADFDGNIESKTREHRFSMAISPGNASSWSIGASLGRVDCGTSFCGTFAEDPGNYTIASAGATAISFGLGAKYHLNERLSLAFNISDPATHLRVETNVTDANGTERKVFNTAFPTNVTAGLFWRYRDGLNISADIQRIWGNYGDKAVDFRILRGGVEAKAGDIYYRFGVILPWALKTTVKDFADDLPFPFVPTAGIGRSFRIADVSFAVYPNAVMSTSKNRAVTSADLSVVFKL